MERFEEDDFVDAQESSDDNELPPSDAVYRQVGIDTEPMSAARSDLLDFLDDEEPPGLLDDDAADIWPEADTIQDLENDHYEKKMMSRLNEISEATFMDTLRARYKFYQQFVAPDQTAAAPTKTEPQPEPKAKARSKRSTKNNEPRAFTTDLLSRLRALYAQ